MNANTWLKNATRKQLNPNNYSHDDREQKRPAFDPDHETLERAMKAYLAAGGKITKITDVRETPVNYGHTSSAFFVDDEL
jgi:hypothetical protein